MRPLARKLLVTTGAALASIPCLAGCGDERAQKDRLTGLTPEQVLRQSRDATAGVSAFRLGADVTATAKVTPGSLPRLLTQALEDPLSIVGEGPVNGDDASFDFDATVEGLPALQGNLTKVGGAVFAGVLGTDYRVDLPRAEVATIVPGRLPFALLSWASAPTEVGREDIDGVRTLHLAATVDTETALDDIMPFLGVVQGVTLRPADRRQLAAALTTKTVDVWIGADDLLPRRIDAELDYRGGVSRLPALRSARLTLRLVFSRFGEGGAVTAPETTNVLDLDRLRSLAGQ